MSVVLPSGQRMPIIGLGTWQASPDEVQTAVTCALEEGYRLIDTAYNYGNEAAIGQAIAKWVEKGGKRDELFVTTKLPNFGNRAADVPKYLTESLSRLGLTYVDLYLLHHPFGFLEPPVVDNILLDKETDHKAVWKAMEAEVQAGRARNIGLSNFNGSQVKKLVAAANIRPANLQVELHAFLQQPELRDICRQLAISVTAYSPLGSPTAANHFRNKYGYNLNCDTKPLENPTVLAIAQRLKKSPGQVLLRFLIELGVAVVPKSSSRDRIIENYQVLNFQLSDSDVSALKDLDKGEQGRIFDFLFYKGVETHPEYPFEKRNVS